MCFTDLEGRLHMLDYDKFLLGVSRQPHLRRVFGPRVYRPAGIGSSPRHRLGVVLLAARMSSVRARCWFGEVLDRTASSTSATCGDPEDP